MKPLFVNLGGKWRGLVQRARRWVVPRVLWWRARHGVFAVDFESKQGLGGKLTACLEVMLLCEEKGLVPRFRFTEEEQDVFGAFFELMGYAEPREPVRFTGIRSMHELGYRKRYNWILDLPTAQRMLQNHLRVKGEVLAEVDEFVRVHFRGRRVLGVHYRGTDKHMEAPAIDYEKVRRNVDLFFERRPGLEVVFVSTDDAGFLEYVHREWRGMEVISREDSMRSGDGRAVHFSPGRDAIATNRDALVNCLVLSRCEVLLKSASYLSAWSKLFNPELPVVMLNRPYEGALRFPERDISETCLWKALD